MFLLGKSKLWLKGYFKSLAGKCALFHCRMEITELSELESSAVSLAEQEVDSAIAAHLRAGFVIHLELVHQFVTLDLKHSMSRDF